jgi:hypothetical protein
MIIAERNDLIIVRRWEGGIDTTLRSLRSLHGGGPRKRKKTT